MATGKLSNAETMQLISHECDGFVTRFLQAHHTSFAELESPDVTKGEQRLQWHEVFRRFKEESELTLQNTLMFWGVATSIKFEEDFLYAAQSQGRLDGFLGLTDYDKFIEKMYMYVDDRRRGVPLPASKVILGGKGATEAVNRRLGELDARLAQVEYERNELLVERRRLLGCDSEASTSASLQHAIQQARWKDEVGLD